MVKQFCLINKKFSLKFLEVNVDEMFKNESFICHKIGKRCEDPEEKESDDSCIIKETLA